MRGINASHLSRSIIVKLTSDVIPVKPRFLPPLLVN